MRTASRDASGSGEERKVCGRATARESAARSDWTEDDRCTLSLSGNCAPGARVLFSASSPMLSHVPSPPLTISSPPSPAPTALVVVVAVIAASPAVLVDPSASRAARALRRLSILAKRRRALWVFLVRLPSSLVSSTPCASIRVVCCCAPSVTVSIPPVLIPVSSSSHHPPHHPHYPPFPRSSRSPSRPTTQAVSAPPTASNAPISSLSPSLAGVPVALVPHTTPICTSTLSSLSSQLVQLASSPGIDIISLTVHVPIVVRCRPSLRSSVFIRSLSDSRGTFSSSLDSIPVSLSPARG